jgi:hypothetical protein
MSFPFSETFKVTFKAPRLWSIHIDRLLTKYHSTATTHAPCVYRATIQNEEVLFLRQVADFAIGTISQSIYDMLCNDLDHELHVPLKRQGLLTHYNGIDIVQTQHYIHLHSDTYIQKVLHYHSWTDILPTKLPMSSTNAYIRTLNEATPDSVTPSLETSLFRYRGAIGELIWAMLTCRPEISFPVVKLSQFATAPAQLHYDAVMRVFRFLAGTSSYGLTYWRTSPVAELPIVAPPARLTNPGDFDQDHNATPVSNQGSVLFDYADTDWAMDIRHRRSISGIIFMLAGDAVSWKCRVQPTVSLSSCETEFLSACDACKTALCLRSILDELGVPQHLTIISFADNRGPSNLATSTAVTMLFSTGSNVTSLPSTTLRLAKNAAALASQVGLILFACHLDNISGRIIPPYSPLHALSLPSS